MKTLLTILLSLIILIVIIPLAWILIKELIFFFGLVINGWAFLSVIFIIIFIVLIIYILS